MENIASSVCSIAQYRFILSRKVVQWPSSRVNNYGYESKRRREKIYFRVYRSTSFFIGFVECQEQGLKQENKKNERYEHLLRKYGERFPDADKNELIKKFNSLHTNFRKEADKRFWKSGTGADDIVQPTLRYFEEMKFLIGQEEPCTSLNTIQIGEEREQECEEVDNVGDTSAINTISVSNHFIRYLYCIMQIYVAMKLDIHY